MSALYFGALGLGLFVTAADFVARGELLGALVVLVGAVFCAAAGRDLWRDNIR